MKLSEFKTRLTGVSQLRFRLSNGQEVPSHFHITEVGRITRHFIDCGGTVRKEDHVNFQLWEAGDLDHRLQPSKLLRIIALSENALGIKDAEIEVEYQGHTIGRYGLESGGTDFILTATHTACLASDACGSHVQDKLVQTDSASPQKACCEPGSGCC